MDSDTKYIKGNNERDLFYLFYCLEKSNILLCGIIFIINVPFMIMEVFSKNWL